MSEIVITAIYLDGPPSRFYRPAPSGVPAAQQQAADDLSGRLRELAARFADGTVDEVVYEIRAGELKDRRRALLRTAVALTPTAALATLPDKADAFRKQWVRWSVDKQRAVLAAAVTSVEIGPGTPGVVRFDLDRFRFNWRDGLNA